MEGGCRQLRRAGCIPDQRYTRLWRPRRCRCIGTDRPLQQQRPYLSDHGIHLPPSCHREAGPPRRTCAVPRRRGPCGCAPPPTASPTSTDGSLRPIQIVPDLGCWKTPASKSWPSMPPAGACAACGLQCHPPLAGRGDDFAALALRLSRCAAGAAGLKTATHGLRKAAGCCMRRRRQTGAGSRRHLREASASLLGNDIGQMRLAIQQRTRTWWNPPYRDDNAGLWRQRRAAFRNTGRTT